MKSQPLAKKKRKKRPAAVSKRAPYDPTAEIIRPRHLPSVVGLSYTTVYRYRLEGKFPEPIKLGKEAVGWRRSTIDRWLAERENGPAAA